MTCVSTRPTPAARPRSVRPLTTNLRREAVANGTSFRSRAKRDDAEYECRGGEMRSRSRQERRGNAREWRRVIDPEHRNQDIRRERGEERGAHGPWQRLADAVKAAEELHH